MKILIHSPFFPPRIGGLEKCVEQIAIQLAEQKHEITLFTTKHEQRDKTKYNFLLLEYPSSERVTNFPIPKIWTQEWKIAWNKIKQNGPYDLVITNTRFFLNSLYPLFQKKMWNTWFHIEYGSTYVHTGKKIIDTFAWTYDQIFGKLVFKKATQVIAIKEDVKTFVKRLSGRDAHICEVAALDLYTNNLSKKHILNTSKKIKIGFLGRLYKSKNVESLIDAFETLNLPNCELFIVGDGPERKELEKKSTNQIHFLGSLPHADGISFLKQLDIYVHSSEPGGGVSISLIEGLYNVPLVVATPYEGGKELVNKNNGILTQGHSSPSIRTGLDTAIQMKKMKVDFRKVNKEMIFEKYTWEKVVKKLLNIYENTKNQN